MENPTIQNQVEETLVKAGYWRTARAYIVYREQHARLRALRHTLVDVESAMEEYLEQRDWRVNANANQGYSLGGLILNVAGKVTANYWLSNVFTPEAGQAHRDGDIHIHDLDMLSGYCAGWSLRQLLTEGFNGIPGKIEATPPRHMSAAIGQIVNFLGTLQNEWAGAQAFSSFDTYMAPFIRRDAMTYTEVKQCMQELIYNLNVPSRWGTQTPFTNLTFDWTCPADLKEQIPYVGGEEMPFAYGDLQTEMDMINRAYIEVMMAGDAKGRVFTFPIPTYNITPDFDWDHPNTERLFEMTARYGLPYFQNFLNSDLEPHMVRSMCCRLQLDLRELLKRGNGLFGSAEQTGSVGVVTVNCARLGHTCRGDEAALMARLDLLLGMGRDVLETKRKVVQRYIDQGLYPYTRRYLGTLRNHFSTLGVNGINEMIRNFSDDAEDVTTPAGHAARFRQDRYQRHFGIVGGHVGQVQRQAGAHDDGLGAAFAGLAHQGGMVAHRLHDVHGDHAAALRGVERGAHFTVQGDPVGVVDLLAVAAVLGLLDQVGMVMAQVHTGDGADRVLAGDRAGQAVGGNANAHAALDDGQQFASGESEGFEPRHEMGAFIGNSGSEARARHDAPPCAESSGRGKAGERARGARHIPKKRGGAHRLRPFLLALSFTRPA